VLSSGGPQPHVRQRLTVHLDPHAATIQRVPDLHLPVAEVVGRALQRAGQVAPAGRQTGEHRRGAPTAGRCGQRGRGGVQHDRLLVGQGSAEHGRVVPLQEGGVDVAGQPGRRAQHPHEQVAVGAHAMQPGPRERSGQPGRCLRACAAVREHLRQHRVVVGADDRARLHPAVDADARPARDLDPVQRAGGRQEAAGRVLGVEPRLDRMTVQPRLGHGRRQRLAAGDEQLQPHEVQARHQLGDGVLDLQPGVHLEEGRLAVLPDHELHRARAGVADRACGRDGGVAEPGTQRLVDAARAPPPGPSGAGRCTEQSRSNSATQVPWVSAMTCTSTCRGPHDVLLEEHGLVTEGEPASRWALPTAADSPSGSSTMRIPRPPPPALAFTRTG
jgi:hypothetical protein